MPEKHLKRILRSAFVFNMLFLLSCRVPDVRDIKGSKMLESPLTLQNSSRESAQNGFSGAESCKDCHLKIYHRWKQTAHNRELQERDYDFPPHRGNCRRCHNASPKDTVVSCEACHGPRASHVLQPGEDETSGCITCDIHKMCIKCHIRSVDPGFEPAEGWTKVDHGRQR